MGRHSKYPEEFRRESVRLVLTTDKSMAEVARDLGINYKMLGNWVRAEQPQPSGSGVELQLDVTADSRIVGKRPRSTSCARSLVSTTARSSIRRLRRRESPQERTWMARQPDQRLEPRCGVAKSCPSDALPPEHPERARTQAPR